MCDDRERLIGYVYDECDVRERREIEQHLESCHTCRREITGLRDVRQDLLAWNVPDMPSVWRPFAPQRTPVTWRDVPGWMLAAAASLVFVAGAAGGVATHTLLPHATVVAAPSAPPLIATATSGRVGLDSVNVSTLPVSAAELRDIEARLIAMESRLRRVSERPAEAVAVDTRTARDIARQIEELRAEQLNMNLTMQSSVGLLQQRANNIEGYLRVNTVSGVGGK